MQDKFEMRILAEYNRRFKQLDVVGKKAGRLKDLEMTKEANEVRSHFELLLTEIEAYYKKYRQTLVKYGVLPQYPLEIELSKDEKDTAAAWQREHRKRSGI